MNPYTDRVVLGRLEIDFSGADFIADAVREEVAHQDGDCNRYTGRLFFNFGHTADAGDSAVSIDDLEVGNDIVRVGDRLLPYSLRREVTDLEVTVASTAGFWKIPLVAPAVRLIDQSFNDSARRLSKRFYYTILDQTVQIAQVPLRQSWIHSSSVTNGERTLLSMAWGGAGKTATLLKMLETGSWCFLSDDLAAIDESGIAVLQADFDPLAHGMAAIHSASPSQKWPSADEMIRDTTSIISSGLSNAESRCFIVGVPELSCPDDLLRVVVDQILA